MKLKYYLKGFGIGILFATIVIGISFYVSGKGKELSDKDIISRAEVLGMVMEEETTTVKESEKIEETTIVEETTVEEETTRTQETTTTQEATSQVEESTTLATVLITIEKGYSSDRVAMILEQKGIVKDYKDFNQYMIDQGVSRRLQSGTYEMNTGMSYEDIINIIR